MVVMGLLRTLKRQGIDVRGAKAGPDFIDPIYHSTASGHPSITLDTWALRPSTLNDRIARALEGQILLVEGGMGLFDGGLSGIGSTASLAQLTQWPVVLVIDVSRQGQSVGALIRGFQQSGEGIAIRGCIFNRVGSLRHQKLILEAIEDLEIEVLGMIPRRDDLQCPSRHLGLILPQEERLLEEAATAIESYVALDKVLSVAHKGRVSGASASPGLQPLGQRIAVARDRCFCFTYPDTLREWREWGAELTFFSPLADEGPEDGCDAVFLPGGYPELYPQTLSGNRHFLHRLREVASHRCPIYGECGGYMVLGTTLQDQTGFHYPMAGLLPIQTSFLEPRLHLGYRRVRGLGANILASTGFRGHEFHYAVEREDPIERGGHTPLFEAYDLVEGTNTQVGCQVGSVAGSFIHLMDREGV